MGFAFFGRDVAIMIAGFWGYVMIFIYSGEVPALDRRLSYELGVNHRLLTIPYAPEEAWAAHEARDYFRACGVNAHSLGKRAYRDKQRLRDEMFISDAVYLTGGNTFEFLAYAREIGLFSLLQAFEAVGGIIVSESAGSIILSKDISTAAIPTTSPDENSVGVTEFEGMARLPFHVSPHFEADAEQAARELEELQGLADMSGSPVLLLSDGEGVVIQGSEVVFSSGSPGWLSPADSLASVVALEGANEDGVAKRSGQPLAG